MKMRIWISMALMCCSTIVMCANKSKPKPELHMSWHLDSINLSQNSTYATFTITASHIDLNSTEWTLYYNQIAGVPKAVHKTNLRFEHITGDYFKMYRAGTAADNLPNWKLVVPVKYSGIIDRISDAPLGPYIETGHGDVLPIINYTYSGFESAVYEGMPLPDAKSRYAEFSQTEVIAQKDLSWIPKPNNYDVYQGEFYITNTLSIWGDPELNNEVQVMAGNFRKVLAHEIAFVSNPERADIRLEISESIINPEGYAIVIDSSGIAITGGGPAGVFYGVQSIAHMVSPDCLESGCQTIVLPFCEVEDEPRFAYRGLHFDVSRNFHPKEDVIRLIDQMAFYKLNKLQFTLTNDEGWRIEIPDLPELVELGSKRGHTTDESTHLYPAYGSGPFVDADGSTGSGYYTREDFIEILRFAQSRHVEVIPEIDVPGHARAAIKSMEARRKRLVTEGRTNEAEQYLLYDADDVSEYVSAQRYSDNVMCVCMESTYAFIKKVFSEIDSMYMEAGVDLNVIHMGGDEIPYGVWSESQVCKKLFSESSKVDRYEDLYPYFLDRLIEITGDMDVQLAGWEEVTLELNKDGHNTVEINEALIGRDVVPYVWNSVWGWGREDMAYRLANVGYPVVMCNSMSLYFDMAYNRDPQEPGLTWSGTVDTRDVFDFEPLDLFANATNDVNGNPLDQNYIATRKRLEPNAIKNVLGIQGQVWCETISGRDRLDYMIFPKLLALSERSWSKPVPPNTLPAAWSDFASRVGQVELPLLDYLFEGVQYRIPLPGVEIANGEVVANVKYPGLILKGTADGSVPTYNSQPVKALGQVDPEKVRIKAFTTTGRAGRESRID